MTNKPTEADKAFNQYSSQDGFNKFFSDEMAETDFKAGFLAGHQSLKAENERLTRLLKRAYNRFNAGQSAFTRRSSEEVDFALNQEEG